MPFPCSLMDVIYLPSEKKLHLVFEYAEYDLKKYLSQNKNTITQNQIRLIMFQLVNGINFCHSRRIIHRDLKPQNLLVDRNGTFCWMQVCSKLLILASPALLEFQLRPSRIKSKPSGTARQRFCSASGSTASAWISGQLDASLLNSSRKKRSFVETVKSTKSLRFFNSTARPLLRSGKTSVFLFQLSEIAINEGHFPQIQTSESSHLLEKL